MQTKNLRRTLAAVVTALACLMALGNPAAAIPTTYTATIATGEITITKTGITPEVINLGSTTSCTGSTINVNFTSNTTSATVTVTAFNGSHVTSFANGGSYLVVLTRSASGNTPGHLNSTTTPHTIGPVGTTPPRVSIVATVYNTTSCTPTGTPVCTLALSLTLTNITTTSVSTSTTFSFTGSAPTIVAFPTCTSGPSFLLGSAVNVTSPVTGHFTGTV
jgi:hypothetical protein